MTNRHDRRRIEKLTERRARDEYPIVKRLAARFANWVTGRLQADNYGDTRTLYHYTDLFGVEHILTGQQLRLTGLSKLRDGDRREVEFGLDLATDLLRTYRADNAGQRAFFDDLATFSLDKFGEHFDLYIACFTPHAEDAAMWRDYGRNGAGVALGIRGEFFQSSGVVDLPEKTIVVQPVIYGEEAVRTRLTKGLDATKAAMREAEKLRLSKLSWMRLLELMRQQLMGGFIVPTCLVAKEDRFRPEEEIRAISINSRKSNAPSRDPYRLIDLTRKEIATSYYGSRSDIRALREIWQLVDRSASLKQASYFPLM